ncbi:MAG: DHA2 family efflux MFS transporter permease subunit, partial [Sphingobium sp.]
GQKNLLLGSVAGFIVASALCGIAQSLPEMILFRTLQGALGAPLIPVSLSVMLDSLPRHKHASTMAVWGAGLMVGPLLGPIVGGWLTENLNWRWVFLLNVPIGIPALIGCWLTVPKLPHKKHRFDQFGYVLLAISLISFQLMLDRGERQEWFESIEIILEGGIALSCFLAYIIHTATSVRPLYPRELFGNSNYLIALVLIFVVGVTLFSSMALMPPMLQTLYGYPVTFAGLVLSPRGAGTMISMLLAGRLLAKIDPRLCVFIGLLLVAWSSYETARFSLEVSWVSFAVTGFVQGTGVGLVSVPVNILAFSTLPGELRPDATGLYSLTRNIGSAIGISATSTLLTRNTQISHSDLVNAMASLPNWSNSPIDVQAGLIMMNAEISRQATMIAYLDDFYLLAILALVVSPLLLFLRRPPTIDGNDREHLIME